jgi:hypothetical protein
VFNDECLILNVGWGDGRRREGLTRRARRARSERQATAESARRVAMATKWGKMEEDVFAAT